MPIMRGQRRGFSRVVFSENGRPLTHFSGFMVNVCSPSFLPMIPSDGIYFQSWIGEERDLVCGSSTISVKVYSCRLLVLPLSNILRLRVRLDKCRCAISISIFGTSTNNTGMILFVPFSPSSLIARVHVATFCRVFMRSTRMARTNLAMAPWRRV